MTKTLLNQLLTRRSVVANKLSEPGPNDEELDLILQAASRAPDHKKLEPWRFVLFRSEAREKFGKVLAKALQNEEEEVSETRLEMELRRFMRAPIVIAVITSFKYEGAVPEWEQILSTGAVCQNTLIAATALGYSAQWITEWYTYNTHVQDAMGMEEHERIAGFIYIGTASEPPKERKRPNLDEIVTEWTGE